MRLFGFGYPIVLVVELLTASTGNTTYEAVIRYASGSTGHITIEARNHHEAAEQIKARYCGGADCIVEGPWVRH